MTASRAINKYLYLNRELQEQTGWLDLHARFYDPTIGRFLTIDPQTDSQEHLSPYHYGYDNPIRFSDPEGRMGDDCCGGVVSFVAGVGSAFRDNFGSPDGRSLYRDQVSHVGEYNSGREWGHKASLVASAAEIAIGMLGDGAALTGEVASVGLATPVAAALGAASTGAIVHGFNSANNAVNNLQKDKGRLEAKSKNKDSKNESAGFERMGKSHGNTPRNNQAQNEQTRTLSKKYDLDKSQQRKLHDMISKKGYSFKEIEGIIKKNFNKKVE